MHRSLSPVSEDDQHTSSSSATSSEDLPTVTPITRTFTATIERQNDENEKLRKKIAKLKATLQATRDELNDTAEVLAANVSSTHRPSTPPLSMPVPSSPLGLTPRLPRPQDVAYQAALKGQKDTTAPTDSGRVQKRRRDSQTLL
jgi:ABC-type transporter Mla subunit MlaD